MRQYNRGLCLTIKLTLWWIIGSVQQANAMQPDSDVPEQHLRPSSQVVYEVEARDMETTHGRIRASRNRVRLTPEMAAYMNAISRIRENVQLHPTEDETDIVLLIQARGRSQTLTVINFLAAIEEAIRRESKIPTAMLAWAIDSVVGARAGAIPAVMIALGQSSIGEAGAVVGPMQTVRIRHEDPEPGCCACRANRKLVAAMDAQNVASRRAHSSTGTMEPRVDDELINNTQNQTLLERVIHFYSRSDFVCRCEILGTDFDDGPIEAILRAASGERRREVMGYTELATAWLENALRITSMGGATLGNEDVQKGADRAVDIIEQWRTPADVSGQGDFGNLRDELADGTRTTRNTVVMVLSTRAYSGGIPLICSVSRVEQARSGREVVMLNVGITIPAIISRSGRRNEVAWRDVYSRIESVVNGQGDSSVELSIRAFVDLLAAEVTRAAGQVSMADSELSTFDMCM